MDKINVTNEVANDLIGKPVADVLARNDLEWRSCYPTVEGTAICHPGIVDGNYPNEWLDGGWHIVDDDYAVADEVS